MLMSPILKARGQRSPSNPRAGHQSTNGLDAQNPQSNKRAKASKATKTLDDGREFDDLPLLVESGDGQSDDESDNDVRDMTRTPTKSRTEKASETRNRRQIVERDTTDKRTLSKYLPTDITDVIGGALSGPDDVFVPPTWLLKAIENVYNTHTPTPTAPPV
jgi:hypothetical protein